MMYPFLTLADQTEITHSEFLEDETVKIYVEKPDKKDCFHHMTCYIPGYKITEVFGFTEDEVAAYMKMIRSASHLIMQYSKEGGFAGMAED